MNEIVREIDRIEEELLYQRTARKNADPFRVGDGYEADPVGFIEGKLGVKLYDKQREIAEAVRDDSRVAVPGAHGQGKDFLIARIVLWWIAARRGFAILTAATERQLLGILMRRELRAALAASGIAAELFTNRLVIDGSDRLVAFPSSSVSSMTGWHAERVLIAISEGQGEAVEAAAYDAAFSMATNAQSRILVVGNPIAPSGRFYDVCHSPGWHTIRMSCLDHPNIVTGMQVIPGGPDRSWIESVEQEYGRDSDYFRSRVEALFPRQAIDSLIPREWLEAAIDRWKAEAPTPAVEGVSR